MMQAIPLYREALVKAGGAGSRGGSVIGETKTGSPIYASRSASHASYRGFTASDHSKAFFAHENKAEEYRKQSRNLRSSGDRNIGGKREILRQKIEHHGKMADSHLHMESHLERQASVEKSQGGGAGSRGASVLGRTSSGKPIYAHHPVTHAAYKRFSAAEHGEASDAHHAASVKADRRGDHEAADHHLVTARSHGFMRAAGD